MGEMTADRLPLSLPEPLQERHHLDASSAGKPSLDNWLRRKARANQASGVSHSYVLCRGDTVVGYYALAAGSVSYAHLSRSLRRNMPDPIPLPDPIPVIVLGRLAIASGEQGSGLGRALLRDALLRISSAAREIGIAAVLVYALNDRARDFYLGADSLNPQSSRCCSLHGSGLSRRFST